MPICKGCVKWIKQKNILRGGLKKWNAFGTKMMTEFMKQNVEILSFLKRGRLEKMTLSTALSAGEQ